MTATELQARIEKAQNLPVICAGKGIFYVESEEGKICYRTEIDSYGDFICSCADFQKNSRHDRDFKCKHILAVLNTDADDVALSKYLEKRKPKLDERWIMNLKGKDFVLYAGLLDLAHQKGLLKLEVEAIQYPNKENGNVAICRAVAVSRLGEVFSDIGDADPSNTNSMISKHLLRMASTRAKARVLRDMANIGMTALEELGDLDDVVGSDNHGKKATVTSIKSQARRKKSPEKTGETAKADNADKKAAKKSAKANDAKKENVKMSPAQKRAILNLAKRRSISEEELNRMAHESFKCDFTELSPADAGILIRQLQQSA
jgi:hypothetical protein